MNSVRAFNTLLSLRAVMNKLSITYWLDGGTLLGARRENGFMDSDFDVDIGIYGEDDVYLKEIREELSQMGFTNFHLKQHPCGEGKQLSFINGDIPGDIFVYYKRGDKRWRLMFDIEPLKTVRYIPCVFPGKLFNNFQTIDFMDYGMQFNMPNPVEEYLTLQYGDWVKDKGKDEFHWQTDYKSMDMNFPIFNKPEGKRRWFKTESIIGNNSDGEFFIPLLREGYKLFPILVNKRMEVIDGNKRLSAYRKLKIPMVEAYINE